MCGDPAGPALWPAGVGSAGVEEPGKGTTGPPGTWEALSSPHVTSGRGYRKPTPGPPLSCSTAVGAKSRAHVEVRPSEGNEVRPEGPQGVGALHSTVEAGELDPREPV